MFSAKSILSLYYIFIVFILVILSSYCFLLFFKFQIQSGLAFDHFFFSIPSYSESLLPLLDNAPFYYIEQPKPVAGEQSMFADFCQVMEQPRYHLKYYKNLHDQTDESLLKNQKHFMSVDNVLYILSDDSLLRAYNMTFQDENQNLLSNVLELYHVNEILLDVDNILLRELASGNYVKLLYEENNHMMFIVSSKIIYVMSLDFDKIRTWMKPIRAIIPVQDDVVRADIVDGFLYILRTFNNMEIWDVSNVANMTLISKINLQMEVGGKALVNITDFDVTDGFLAFTDKNSRMLYIYDATNFYSNLASRIIYSVEIDATPNTLFLYANKVLVLAETYFKQSVLQEFELFQNKTASLLRKTLFPEDVIDLVVGEIYVMAAFHDHVELFPHFYTTPMYSPQLLKFTENMDGIQAIDYFQIIWESSKNESDYFTLMINGEITVAKVQALPGALACNPENKEPGNYSADIVIYEVDCPFLNQYCNSSQIIKKHELFEVAVVDKKVGFLGQRILKSEGTQILFLGVFFGLILGVGFTSLFCWLHIRNIKEKNSKLFQQVGGQNRAGKLPDRIMSQDELVVNTVTKMITDESHIAS